MTPPVGEVAGPRIAARVIVAAVIAAVLLVVGGIAIGRLTSPTPPLTPSSTSAEAGFARDMQTHHQQAVQLAMIIRAESDDQAVLTLAYDIATTQAQQAGQMFGWLSSWHLPQAAPEPSMTWMTRPGLDGSSHEHESEASVHVPGEPMPGLAKREQIAALDAATGPEADRMFLELMIVHHQGGIEMASALLERSTNDIAAPMAKGIVFAQQGEIDYMEGLLNG